MKSSSVFVLFSLTFNAPQCGQACFNGANIAQFGLLSKEFPQTLHFIVIGLIVSLKVSFSSVICPLNLSKIRLSTSSNGNLCLEIVSSIEQSLHFHFPLRTDFTLATYLPCFLQMRATFPPFIGISPSKASIFWHFDSFTNASYEIFCSFEQLWQVYPKVKR